MYFIKNQWQGKYLDHDQADNRTTVWDFHGYTNQQWKVTKNSDGSYRIMPYSSAKRGLDVCMDADSTMTFSPTGREFPKRYGTDVQLYEYYGGSNQKFVFEKVDYGNAPSYSSIATSSLNINCAGFALRINQFISGSMLGGVTGSSWDTVESIASKTITYFNNNTTGRTIRRISGVNNTPTFSINSNEYRVALRVRTPNTGYSTYDYHFYIQTIDGQWANKPGSTPSAIIGYVNPSTYAWANGYNSDVIYFAVTR